MVDKTPAEPKITDISVEFTDLNPEDRIYRSSTGEIVKVKTWQIPVEDPQVLAFRITASLVDPKTGKAIDHPTIPEAKHISDPYIVQIHTHAGDRPSPDNEPQPAAPSVAEEIEAGRHLIVRRVELGEINRRVAAIPGLALLPYEPPKEPERLRRPANIATSRTGIPYTHSPEGYSPSE